MRNLFCALLLAGVALAGDSNPAWTPRLHYGSFYVNGIAYHYETGSDYTVVVAAHSLLNHKLLGVKLRVLNDSRESITIKPEDVLVEDVVASRPLELISGGELSKRIRRPYNMAKYGVMPDGGGLPTGGMSGMFGQMPPSNSFGNVPFDSSYALLEAHAKPVSADPPRQVRSHGTNGPSPCDTGCRLLGWETADSDVLTKLQHAVTPESVEDSAFVANTISPDNDVSGVLFYPRVKLAHDPEINRGKKGGLLRVTIPIEQETFQFLVPVE